MKKIWTILLAMAALFVAVPSHAQLQWGIRGGVNLAKASFSGADVKSDNYTGYFFGPTAEFTIPLIGLGLDGSFLFSQSGIKTDDETLKRSSFEIPINLKYNIGLGSMAGIYIAAGPQYGINLKSDEGERQAMKDFSFKNTNLSVNVGAGVKLIRHLQIGFTYNIPMGKTGEYDGILNGAAGAVNNAISAKVKTWQINAAYMF